MFYRDFIPGANRELPFVKCRGCAPRFTSSTANVAKLFALNKTLHNFACACEQHYVSDAVWSEVPTFYGTGTNASAVDYAQRRLLCFHWPMSNAPAMSLT